MSDALKIARGFALPLDLVTEATAIVATRGAGKSSTSAVLVEESFPVGVQSVVFDRTGVYWGLRSNKDGDGPGLGIYVLGGAHGDVPLEPHAGKLIADLVVDSGHSFVLDLSDFSKGAAVKFAADFLERLFDRKARSRTTTMLVIDEAHFYAPQTPRGGFKGDSARLMGAMEDVVGLGRSRGLGVVLTTQRTQALNKAVLDLIETLIVMRMLSPRARDAVQDWIREKQEDDRVGVIATLDSLPDGTAWVWSPLRGILEKVPIRRIKTFDSFATPKAGQARAEPTARRELDLGALGEQMRATAERAKENDPAELRKRIRELEHAVKMALDGDEASALQSGLRAYRDLAQRIEQELFGAWEDRTPDAVIDALRAEKARAVEVPVLSAGELLEVTTLVNQATGIVKQLAEALVPLAQGVNKITASVDGPVSTFRGAVDPVAPAGPPPKPSDARQSVTRVVHGSPEQLMEKAREALADPVRTSTDPVRNGSLPPSEQKILDALAWYEALRIPQPTRHQVAFVAGYKAGGGRFINLLGALRAAGMIDYPQSGIVALTAQGRGLARDPDLPRTNEALHRAVFDRLQPSQAKLLDVVIAYYPGSLSRERLAEATGYEARGGRFVNLLGSLRTLGLIDYPQSGEVAALDVLFPVR